MGWRNQFLTYLAQTTEMPMLVEVTHAEGNYIYGPGGKAYLDLISGIGVSSVGHHHPAIVAAVESQVHRHAHVMVYGEFVQPVQVRLAERLVEKLGPPFEQVYLVNSGSEAVEGALKLARRHTGRPWVVSFDKAYHGSTTGALSVAGEAWLARGYRPVAPGVRRLPFNATESLSRIDSHTAAVIIEPIQGEAGARPAEPAFLRALRAQCDRTGALLIFDEVQTGMGRTGQWFAFQGYDVVPDIVVLGKALGGGYPLGAFAARREVMEVLTHDPFLGHITTFGGHPVSCAAALAAMDIMETEGLMAQVPRKEALFREKLRGIRGKGLLLSVPTGSLERSKAAVHRLLERGIITDWFLFEHSRLRIAPPLTITPDEVGRACTAITEVLSELA